MDVFDLFVCLHVQQCTLYIAWHFKLVLCFSPDVLRGYAQEVESRDGRHLRDTPSSFSGHMGAGLGPRHYTVHLRAVLILQFMEHLDKLMYNAYEGSCVTLPPVPKVS